MTATGRRSSSTEVTNPSTTGSLTLYFSERFCMTMSPTQFAWTSFSAEGIFSSSAETRPRFTVCLTESGYV